MEPAPVAIKLIEPEENDEWQPRKTAQAFQEQMRALQKATMARARGEQAGEQERQADFDDTRPPEEEAEQRSKVVSLRDWRVRYYHNDHLGTPRELSDEDGGIVWQATYKAWGNTLKVEAAWPATLQNSELLAQTGRRPEAQNDPNAELQPIEQNLRFQGQYFDQETGLHYNRFRYYDPEVGRFIHQDPIGLLGGFNLYQYAPNPLDWTDPLGWWKGQPRGGNGRFGQGKDPSKPQKPEGSGHGNSKDNPSCTTLYKLVNPDGSVSKWGITSEQNPANRYSKSELGPRIIVPVATGSRSDMLSLERAITIRFGGPENKESWANKVNNSTSPEAIMAAFKAANRGCINIL